MNYYISAACGCNIGKYRKNNEDNFYFFGHFLPEENNALDHSLEQSILLSDNAEYFAVFDGMGGQADGQVASNIAANTFRVEISKNIKREENILLNDIAMTLSEAVWKRAEKDSSDTGTTAAILGFKKDKYYLCNVGDSPIYLYNNTGLNKISKDHTDEEFLRFLGIKKTPSLTQYVGICPEELIIEPNISSDTIHFGDQFLICSDGLTDMVTENEITLVLSMDISPKEKVDNLIDMALKNGGKDNVTIIIINICNSLNR